MENPHGLVADGRLFRATGTAERDATLDMLDAMGRGQRRITLGGDKGYDARDFVHDLRRQKVTPDIARNDHIIKSGRRRKTAVDGRTTRHSGYEVSQCIRKRIEEIFGWIKGTAGLRQTKFRGRERVSSQFTLALAAYNLIRLPKLLEDTP